MTPAAGAAPAAVIDIGSNSVLCLIGARTADGQLAVLQDMLATTRLGSGLRDGGLLDPEARARTRVAVAAFARRARQGGAHGVVAVATAAMRAASDGAAFAQEIEAETGVPVTILTGADEARLAYEAVAALRPPPLLAVDVGGRSTELVLGVGTRLPEGTSLSLGALALTEALVGAAPPTAAELAAVVREVERVLASSDLPARAQACRAHLVASGGTATALAAVDLGLPAYDRERVHGHVLRAERLTALAAVARGAALEPDRRRILPAGAVMLEAVARAADVRTVVVSDRGVRHAFLTAVLAARDGPP